MIYLFKTTATMKEYNCKNWWIDQKIIKDIEIESDNINEALKKYAEIVKEKYYVYISKNALKTKHGMYIDIGNESKQVGYVITGKTEFEHDYRWSMQYIDLWVTIKIIQSPF